MNLKDMRIDIPVSKYVVMSKKRIAKNVRLACLFLRYILNKSKNTHDISRKIKRSKQFTKGVKQ